MNHYCTQGLFILGWEGMKNKFLANESYMQNILKKSEILVYKNPGRNQSYYVTLKLENQQTMFIGPKFILL